MKKSFIFYPVLFVLTSAFIFGQETPVEKGLSSITTDVIKAQLGFLASDWTEGREAGEKGEYLAGDYVASMLQLYGLKPGGDISQSSNIQRNQAVDGKSYFQNFSLIKSLLAGDQVLKIISGDGSSQKTITLTYNVDFVLRNIIQNAEYTAPVEFAGYGFMNKKLNYNDFDKCELRGKFILKITGTPLSARTKLSAQEIASSVRESDNYIREQGAVGIIEFNPLQYTTGVPEMKDFLNMSPSESTPRTGRPRARYSIPGGSMGDDFVRVEISARAADELLKGTGNSVNDYLKNANSGQPGEKLQLNGKSISLKTSLQSSQIAVRNILGVIEGNNPDQIIVVGAHYDHMGIGNGYIWNGADDNASGTVGVMTLAKAMMATGRKPEKTIVFALWTAEEEGLLGSRYFVRSPSYPLSNLKLNINFDMISRYISDDKPKDVVMTYTASMPIFREFTRTNIKKYNIDLNVDYQPSDNPSGGTDHRSFVEAKIPIIRFKSGHREEYHTPYDELKTINWDIMEKIIKINFLNLYDLANSNW